MLCTTDKSITTKTFIAIRALSDLASGGSADSNEAHTYHCGQYAKLSMWNHQMWEKSEKKECWFLVSLGTIKCEKKVRELPNVRKNGYMWC